MKKLESLEVTEKKDWELLEPYRNEINFNLKKINISEVQ